MASGWCLIIDTNNSNDDHLLIVYPWWMPHNELRMVHSHSVQRTICTMQRQIVRQIEIFLRRTMCSALAKRKFRCQSALFVSFFRIEWNCWGVLRCRCNCNNVFGIRFYYHSTSKANHKNKINFWILLWIWPKICVQQHIVCANG